MKKTVKISGELKKYRFLIVAMLIGILLLTIPSGSKDKNAETDEQRLAFLLESAEGVGNPKVLISENGVVVVCDGAADADVKLTVIKAAEAFTGYSSDKIQVLMSEMED